MVILDNAICHAQAGSRIEAHKLNVHDIEKDLMSIYHHYAASKVAKKPVAEVKVAPKPKPAPKKPVKKEAPPKE